jgi:TonB family protein
MEGEEGAAGAPEEARNTGGGVRVRGDDRDARVPLDAGSVRDLGTLAAMNRVGAMLSTISSPFGAADARGFSDIDAYGALTAAQLGFGPGAGGFGMVGTGRGGCPVGATWCGAGTVGVGRLDTVGSTGGCSAADFARFESQYGRAGALDRCSGTSRRVSDSTLHRDGGGVPSWSHGVAETMGGLSREQIRRVINRNRAQIQFCYEQQLQGQPDLGGRVTVGFAISPTGAVQSADVVGNDTGSERLGDCVSQAVRRWPFPQAVGMTAVSYPFVFSSN